MGLSEEANIFFLEEYRDAFTNSELEILDKAIDDQEMRAFIGEGNLLKNPNDFYSPKLAEQFATAFRRLVNNRDGELTFADFLYQRFAHDLVWKLEDTTARGMLQRWLVLTEKKGTDLITQRKIQSQSLGSKLHIMSLDETRPQEARLVYGLGGLQSSLRLLTLPGFQYPYGSFQAKYVAYSFWDIGELCAQGMGLSDDFCETTEKFLHQSNKGKPGKGLYDLVSLLEWHPTALGTDVPLEKKVMRQIYLSSHDILSYATTYDRDAEMVEKIQNAKAKVATYE